MVFMQTLKGEYLEQMSDEEFFRFCQDNRDLKLERDANGQIIIMSPTTFITGKRNNEILFQLNQWNKKHKLGTTVDSDTGFYLPNGAMRNPDAAWVSHERLNAIDPKELDHFPHLCPDFVVELRSKGDSLKELQTKMQEWMNSGCRLGWLIDADAEIVYVYEGNQQRQHSNFDNPLSGGEVLPNFELIVAELR